MIGERRLWRGSHQDSDLTAPGGWEGDSPEALWRRTMTEEGRFLVLCAAEEEEEEKADPQRPRGKVNRAIALDTGHRRLFGLPGHRPFLRLPPPGASPPDPRSFGLTGLRLARRLSVRPRASLTPRNPRCLVI